MTTTNNKSGKENIKVYVLTGPETSGIVAHEFKENGKTNWRGFSLDVFRRAIQDPVVRDKYTFDFEFMKDPGKVNYEKIVQNVAAGKYDIAIGGFINTAAREKIVDFSVPTKIDSTALFYVPKGGSADIKIQTIKEIATLIGIAVGLGILFGIILHYVNPKRKAAHKGLTKKGFFYRTVMTSVASMFGEMGYLSENSTPNVKGLFIAILLIVIAFLFLIYIQARLTTAMIEERINKNVSDLTIARGIILGHEGYALAKRFEELGGNVKFIKDATNDQLIDMYLKNKDKYIGVALSYCDGFPELIVHPELSTSLHDNHVSGFPVNDSKVSFLNDLNSAIMNMMKDGSLTALCKKYFGKIETENSPTCTLS